MTADELDPKNWDARTIRNMYRTALAEQIAQRREELGLTQEEVADLGGPSSETVRQWELGRIPNRPRAKTLEQFDLALSWATGSARTILLHGTQPTATAHNPLATEGRRTTKRVMVDQQKLSQLMQLSTTLMMALREKEAAGEPMRTPASEAVKSLHMLAAELVVEALNQ